MAEEYKVDNQVNVGWGLSLQMAGKTPAIAKRIFDTYENAEGFVNSTTDTALPGILLSVIKDTEERNGLYYVNKAAGFDGVEANQGELIKIGEGSAIKKVDTFAEAKAYATTETIGKLVYLTTEDKTTTPETTYAVGLYVVTGVSTLAKLGTTSAGGEDLSGEVATLKGKVSSLETSTSEHYGNTTIHLPASIGTDGQILSVSEGAPKWVDKDPAYSLPVAGEELGGIKNGGDITISPEGEVTVTAGKSHTHTISQLSDLGSGWETKLKTTPVEYIPTTEKGTANGVATLNENGKVPVSQLDGAMARVFGVEKAVANQEALPPEATEGQRYYTIDTKKIYEKTSDSWDEGTDPKEDTIYNFRHSDKAGSEDRSNILYRWDGEDMVEISASLALGETSGTAYEGNKGKANADAIAKLNGGAESEGSVAHTATQIVNSEISKLDLSNTYEAKGAADSAKATIDNYTINGNKISENPVLDGSDIALTGYTIAGQASPISGDDSVNTAIGKLEKAISDTTSKAGVVSIGGLSGIVSIESGETSGTIKLSSTEGEPVEVKVKDFDNKADKSVVEAYTVNGKPIKDNPTLGGKDIILTEYVKSETGDAIAVSDSVNTAIGKLEKSIEDKNSTLTNNLTAIKNGVGLGDSYEFVAPEASNYLSGATSVKDALAKLDAAIKANETTALSEDEINAVCKI